MPPVKSSTAGPKALVFSAITIGLGILLARPINRATTVLGMFRTPGNTIIDDANLVTIDDTTICEDLHLHAGLLYTACEDSFEQRFSWFPGLGVLHDPLTASKSRGSIHVIDPKTFKSKRLEFEGFGGPFITHGIDVIADPKEEDGIYIFAVNHVPNSDYLQHVVDGKNDEYKGHKAASQIEIFHHRIGSSTVKHVRSISHPLIQTPNDIVAVSPTSFYVTNDHYYREGLMRQVEDMYYGGKWSNTIFVQITDLTSKDSTAGVNASIALTGLHNNNGLGHGRTPNEIAIGSAASGDIHIADIKSDHTIQVQETVQFDTAVDNPFYFTDSFANGTNDASGYVSAGLTVACQLGNSIGVADATEPVTVWLATKKNGKWEKKILFEDDGKRVRSAATAVLIGVDPKLEGGQKKGWLFVTGFYSRNTIAVKVDL
ncbi:serum paraoxonase arylesterase 2 [Fusarium beomiforme]|uniref:Serum paraoxonase arylesterase 2 n=1 Tax=Fusarium beomiforme TaxID=44412 RepID=A0A9P5AFS6_9HYPO|nr:serum paraoxonase arylesterase 2 [Fusarium beomiforme]